MTDETQPESAALSPTERTRIRRLPERAVSHRQDLYDVLDAGLLAHVGITDETGQTYVLPVAYARDGDRVVIHGSTGSRLFRSLASGAQACFSVTLVDGVVIARSAFESSLNYRSVMVLGRFTVLNDDEAVVALQLITDHLIPGRSAEIRENAKKELAATRVLALDLAEASVKIRTVTSHAATTITIRAKI